mmetsp:Transcript_5366/g.11071  ORF Transcript_5366/g.11071 Transcript_5366/m.11071 type:complete len:562 (+) Transcript_5366:1024-2709(+)|eukprot:CAMPEP_0171486684 /NCGR_PEP_ID=MMETSP0958-20121227/1225_1 /TAXON_ID=87120 /ORGANISM="Aurantiochytrium limacinum, Strain ATCCMYA-1381" /LENGTH=561 /DNA_ID=CAMNT_0012019587 /DNA_START=1302 /DNA_END=2987 /DNA_ORIENTATION=+
MGGGAGDLPHLARSVSIETLPETPRSTNTENTWATRSSPATTPLRKELSAFSRTTSLESFHESSAEFDDEDGNSSDDSSLIEEDEDDEDDCKSNNSHDHDDNSKRCVDEDVNQLFILGDVAAHEQPCSPEPGPISEGCAGSDGHVRTVFGLGRPAPPLSPDDSQQKPRCSGALSVEDEIGIEALLDFSSALPSRLPDFPSVSRDRKSYAGPSDESNWVLPGRLLVGAYPAEADQEAHEKLLSSILSCGVTTFVCLQAEYDHFARSDSPIRPYIRDAYRLCCENQAAMSKKASVQQQVGEGEKAFCSPNKLAFLHLPIVDCKVTGDEVVRVLAEALCWRLVAGEVVYLHCWGGHGRTGTLVAVILGMLYKISKAEALKRTQLYHDCRSCPLQVQSPQTFPQRMQVLRILDTVRGKHSIIEQHARDPLAKRDIGREFELPVDAPVVPVNDTTFGKEQETVSKKLPLEFSPICSDSNIPASTVNSNSKDHIPSPPRALCKRRRLSAPMGSGMLRPLKPPTMRTSALGSGTPPPYMRAMGAAAVQRSDSPAQQQRCHKRGLNLLR